ncbi:hypothetical protein PHYSODRAFT_484306 [Phytophthora sojae]|uniref:Major facilitator superfamily (MFS) profile domain-containing protein n=1 Tax=Phytophthora sojae (strain P6497) TaxID=1094619 RepID=G4YSL0_PHYSP|nr:hypothetical protein PHYSODRAFT_482348 [Phytophthora sojae]XP_009518794.1 hypothetical protein PHYSODRAFT_484306 [Phytophthora sojae]EGZ23503.1 hypothetical protein PHYSODRAFT_482348 [Phytophthora sojae]EGZ23506.1 hypothetical protein PHYSODRAFT_484306 [Phytophthora sojae]|eukprot:XP_009518791.1 hypothetical protein PHYSODRAFT_482348 [Phytophthora sojae]
MRLTCLIVITSFIRNGIFQIQSFFLNTIVGFDVKDFANLMLLGGVLALLGQGLLVKALVGCFKEKGVIIIALIASLMKTGGFAGAAFYPHKWVVFLSFIPGCIGDLTFPAISALKSMNVSEKEQGRLQGAIYGARSVFDAIGPIVFSSLKTPPSRSEVAVEPAPLPPPVSDETPALASVYFETDKDEVEKGDRVEYATSSMLDDDQLLSEPSLGANSSEV